MPLDVFQKSKSPTIKTINVACHGLVSAQVSAPYSNGVKVTQQPFPVALTNSVKRDYSQLSPEGDLGFFYFKQTLLF